MGLEAGLHIYKLQVSKEAIMSDLNEDLKKIFLFGIGAIAKTSEKASKIVDELMEKGALTLEQGKALNEELKHNIKKEMVEIEKELNTEIIQQVKEMKELSDDDIKVLKEKIKEIEKERKAKLQ